MKVKKKRMDTFIDNIYAPLVFFITFTVWTYSKIIYTYYYIDKNVLIYVYFRNNYITLLIESIIISSYITVFLNSIYKPHSNKNLIYDIYDKFDLNTLYYIVITLKFFGLSIYAFSFVLILIKGFAMIVIYTQFLALLLILLSDSCLNTYYKSAIYLNRYLMYDKNIKYIKKSFNQINIIFNNLIKYEVIRDNVNLIDANYNFFYNKYDTLLNNLLISLINKNKHLVFCSFFDIIKYDDEDIKISDIILTKELDIWKKFSTDIIKYILWILPLFTLISYMFDLFPKIIQYSSQL